MGVDTKKYTKQKTNITVTSRPIGLGHQIVYKHF